MPISRKRLDNEVFDNGQWLPAWSITEQFQLGLLPKDLVVVTSGNWLEFHAGMLFLGQEMWPKVETDELLPTVYKNGLGRPRKVRIREYGEDGDRRRRLGVAYKCTKYDKFGHNALSCKSLTQDFNALKRKKNVDVRPDVQANVQPDVNVDVKPDVHGYVQPDVHGDMQPDASQADNKVDIDNNVATSQASSCVVDTRFSLVFDTRIFIGLLHPHIGKLSPLELPIDDVLLPPMFSNPWKMIIDELGTCMQDEAMESSTVE
ncbi:hypothetical protein KIW84_054125 [Lathyrus oleraceus]|uniref:Uncharacterized protein n=1 Tax=Pisum sativum TaxID=3888 RepID=A0A9D4WS93_PEA|nr:hypothetical protein KIW84_054125 [Pisum sativum]